MHTDQAAGLRRLLAPRGMRILPLLGAAGAEHEGVAAAGLARGLVELGSRVLIADQSPGAVARQFGLRARYELAHVIAGDKDWSQVVLPAAADIGVLPAARGLARLANAGVAPLLDGMWRLPLEPDVLILNLCHAEAVQGPVAELVDDADWLTAFSSRPSGLVPAYRAIKNLARVAMPRTLRALACDAADPGRAQAAFGALAAATSRFLSLDMRYCGELPDEWAQRRLHIAPLRALAAGVDQWRLKQHVPSEAAQQKAFA